MNTKERNKVLVNYRHFFYTMPKDFSEKNLSKMSLFIKIYSIKRIEQNIIPIRSEKLKTISNLSFTTNMKP